MHHQSANPLENRLQRRQPSLSIDRANRSPQLQGRSIRAAAPKLLGMTLASFASFVKQIAVDRNGSLLNLALADAGIAAWNAKYTYNSWQPIDAIHLADTDGNPLTQAVSGWTLLSTPSHSDYVSGSTFSSAASQILTSLFGDRIFSSGSTGLSGMTRTFSRFRQAANEAGISRIYGGIHTKSTQAGKATGRALANNYIANFLTPLSVAHSPC